MTGAEGEIKQSGGGPLGAEGTEAEVVAFVRGRSVPCPRCNYELRDLKAAKCPECGEPLVLRIGSQRLRFGWLLLAMAPGCFSGVAAVFVAVPVGWTIVIQPSEHLPIPIMMADAFGFASATGVYFMYKHRHKIVAWPERKQRVFAACVWGAHILAFAMFVLGMFLFAK